MRRLVFVGDDDDLLLGDIRVGGRRAHTAALPAPFAASGAAPSTQRRHPGSFSIKEWINKFHLISCAYDMLSTVHITTFLSNHT